MRLPDQESLIGVIGFLARTRSRRRGESGVFETRRQTRVDLVIPAPAHRPASGAICSNNLPTDLVGRAGFPTASLEIESADVPGRVVANFHRAVVIDCGITRNYADDGGRDLFPSVEFLFRRWVGSGGGWSELEEPCSKRVYVEGFAVEFGFDCGLTL